MEQLLSTAGTRLYSICSNDVSVMFQQAPEAKKKKNTCLGATYVCVNLIVFTCVCTIVYIALNKTRHIIALAILNGLQR